MINMSSSKGLRLPLLLRLLLPVALLTCLCLWLALLENLTLVEATTTTTVATTITTTLVNTSHAWQSSLSPDSSSNQVVPALALAWKNQIPLGVGPKLQQQQQQQQQQSNNLKQESELQQHHLNLDNANKQLNEQGSLNESLTTDFPNPNINNAGHEITKILKKFFLHGYDKRVRPNYSGPPALVNVSFHIIGISSVSEVQMDFTTDFYFRQKWFDPRLQFKPVGQIDELCVGAEFAEKIWLPDTFFANEKTATFHKATTENTFIRVAHNGRVYRSIRLTVTCSCPMDLQYFPMDRQRCKIEIESYGYNTRDIDYRWEKGNESVTLDGKIELPQFKVLGFKMGQELQSLSSGDYIRLYCEIHFVRSMGYYLIQIYIPASLIVIISWVSFWLHRNATPARVALGVTTVLTMTTLMSSTNAALPKISYIKSIDVFLGTCFVMVFASLLEYASVGYIGKRIAMKRKRQQDLKQMQQHHQRVCVAAAASAAAAAAVAQQSNPVGVAPAFIKKNLFQSADINCGGGGGDPQSALISNEKSRTYSADKGSTGNNYHRTHDLYATTTNNNNTTNRAPILVRRFMTTTNQLLDENPNSSSIVDNHQLQLQQQKKQPQPPSYGQRSTIKIILDSRSRNQNVGSHSLGGDSLLANAAVTTNNTSSPTKLLPASSQLNQQPLAEFEQQQQQQQQQSSPAIVGQKETPPDTVRICGLTPSAIDKYSRVVFPICFVCFNLMYWIIYGHISQQIDDKGPPLIPFVRS